MKILKFVGNLYLRHILGIVITVVFIIPLYALASNQQFLFSAITGAISIALIYSMGWRFGFRDARKIKGFFPDKKLPVKAAAVYSVLPLVMVVIWAAVPNLFRMDIPLMRGDTEFFIKGCYINGTPDLIYRIWQIAYSGFIPSSNIFAYILALFVEPLFIYISYCVGLRRFSVMEYISAKIVFKSPNKKRKREDSFRR